MTTANREQAAHWNSEAGAGHWVTNQTRMTACSSRS